MNDYLKEIIVLEQITDSWWKLSFESEGTKAVFFASTEGEVKGKFAAWFRKLKRKL